MVLPIANSTEGFVANCTQKWFFLQMDSQMSNEVVFLIKSLFTSFEVTGKEFTAVMDPFMSGQTSLLLESLPTLTALEMKKSKDRQTI